MTRTKFLAQVTDLYIPFTADDALIASMLTEKPSGERNDHIVIPTDREPLTKYIIAV